MNEQSIEQEPRLLANYLQEQFEEKYFRGVDGCRLRYIRQRKRTSPNGLLILGGRTEFIEKYTELFYDLRRIDCSIYSYDHRGQGLSERLLKNSHKGHVAKFSDYITDLKIFIDLVIAGQHQRIIVLGFSMGGAITALYTLNHTDVIDAAILCCPMFAINTSPLPQAVVGWFAENAVSLGFGENYVPGGKGYTFKTKFAGNLYTSSADRFAFSRKMVQAVPELALGSPTLNWLSEAMLQTKPILARANEISLPVLLLQSSRDRMVRNQAHREFYSRVKRCEFHTVAGARHELLIERDELRNKAMAYITSFVQQHIV